MSISWGLAAFAKLGMPSRLRAEAVLRLLTTQGVQSVYEP
jgi:hypothetical protein